MPPGIEQPPMTSSTALTTDEPQLCVSQLVAEQAAAAPDAIALKAGCEVVSYAQLDSRAERVAQHLTVLGVGSETVVGLYFERSPLMVIGALAILKTGGAYVPLDPGLPSERLNFMLRDAGVSIILTRSDLAESLPPGNWQILALDRGIPVSPHRESLTFDLSSKNLAYVIYTSGSTGRPKGVEITRAGLRNLISWHLAAFQITSSDRASHQASLSFDAAVWELWPYLAAGASVYLPEEDVANHPEVLRDWMVDQGITITFLPTVLAERMLLLDWPPQTSLRILLTGADTLHHRPPARLPFKLVNNYGPTECTVVATSGTVAPAEVTNRPPSIGRPIHNVQTYILDEQMQPVAEGAPGELCIGGAGLARGYRNLPQLTQEKFVSNPFGSHWGRLYRTGDLVRSLPDGKIEFLGRLDDQIKIRGYRIEPKEIVTVLDLHPDVETSFVIAREDNSGDKRLVAYLVLAPNSTLTSYSAREYLQRQLPDYMIPAVFVKVAALPLNPSGKVHRTALPVPDINNILREKEFVAPQGLIEQRLAAVIAPLLHVDRVGSDDNFFLLGGHSLLGTQLLTRIREIFGVELTLLNIFEHPTLAEMSSGIEKLILSKIEAMKGQGLPQGISQTPVRGTAL